MATYEESGVNIKMGDKCSGIAYQAAKRTFPGRLGMVGEPLIDEGGFSGALDMGDYYLVQNDDGVGSKIQIAEMIGKYDTLGYDLIAMVSDDAVCVGAETISVTNTLDVNKLDENKVSGLMKGLEKAALEHKIVVPGGEIAELGNMVNGYIWNSTAVGIVEKFKLINGSKIEAGDVVIGLPSAGIRSNGFSLVRHVLKERFGENWAQEKYDDSRTWGEVTLTPSIIYSSLILAMHGRYKEPAKVELKGVVHVKGGGIPGNIVRVLKKKGLGAKLDKLPEVPELFKRLIEIGNVPIEDAYKTWNMGIAMIIIASQSESEKILQICKEQGTNAGIIGEVSAENSVIIGDLSF